MSLKSQSELAEDGRLVAEIAKAVSFSAHLRVGPHEKYTTRDIPTAAQAFEEAERLTEAHSRFGRGAVVYAVDSRGRSTPCTPELCRQAGAL